ncbi:MAG: S41 family peptidase [Oscillospiraceae bacterium]|jgi:carboxyl-terminal processing protease|nr:S41 family peptidase [Oscillospiraceae bacterium]
MKKRINLITVAVLMALTGLVTYVITFFSVSEGLSGQLDTYSRHREELKTFFDTLDYIDSNFIGESNREKQAQGAAAGLVASLGDPWSVFLDPEANLIYGNNLANSYAGIGIQADLTQSDCIVVAEVLPGSAAEEGDIRVGDRITHVDSVSVAEAGVNAAVEMISGEEYTTVKLTVERPSEGGGSFERELVRQTVLRDVVTSSIIQNIGVVKISNFNDRSNDEFDRHMRNLLDAGVKGLIFDVRDNPGGNLAMLEHMLDALLPEGTLVTLRYKDGTVDVRTSAANCVELPMAVLINGGSVSAAELFAADLKEFGWATLVGEPTGGKGYAQETFGPLSDGSALHLSTSEYFSSKGVSLAGSGLSPDAPVELSEDERQYVGSMDPAADRQLAAALEILTGA